jgi:DNA end-binding protein Ku
VRADGELLVLETLFFADEVRNPRNQIENLPGRIGASPQELRMATELIGAMSGPWKPSDYRDTYTDRVNKLIAAKKNNKEITPASEAPQPTNVTSLMDALQASLDATKSGRSGRKSRGSADRTGGSRATRKSSSQSGGSSKSGSSSRSSSKQATGRRSAGTTPTARKSAKGAA